jgi:FkbM family methyltransferase
MPELTLEAAAALVVAAEKRFAAKEFDASAAVLGTVLEAHPAHYWALLLLARTRREQGDAAAAMQCLRTAIALPTPERVGAYFDLAFHLVAEQRLDEAAPLVEDALGLPETNQTRWYKGRLLFLRALVALGTDQPEAANGALADAYRFERGLNEMPLLFGWVCEAIPRTDWRPDLPYLRYLAAWIGMVGHPIVYRDELQLLGADTRVVAIGAMDGVRFDPLWEFIRSRKWQAVLVEPTATMFRELARNYASYPFVRCVQVAITDRNDPVILHRIRPDAIKAGLVGDWAFGVASLSLDSTLKFYPDLLETETVQGCTFGDLVAGAAIERIDVLQIDTEGHDYAILQQVPLRPLGVRLLHVELVNVDPLQRLAVFETVRRLGYRCHYDGNDLTAVLGETRTQVDPPGLAGNDSSLPGPRSAAHPALALLAAAPLTRAPLAPASVTPAPLAPASLAPANAAARDVPVASPSQWNDPYPQNAVSDARDHSAFGAKLSVTSITDTKIPAAFSRTTIRLPTVAFPASIGLLADGTSGAADPPTFLRACQGDFRCGFSEPVSAIGFLPDHALCIERVGDLELLEESRWHSNLHFSAWFRNDRTTGWQWRVDRKWPEPLCVPGLVAHCYHCYHHQYFHWLVDIMPRVWLLREHSPYATPDQWFVGPLNHEFQRQTLGLYDITPDMCCRNLDGVVRFEAAVCTAFRFTEPLHTRPAYHTGIHHRGWSAAFLDDIRERAVRRHAASVPPDNAPCVYVSRADATHRRTSNEAAVRALVEACGFTVVEPGRMRFEEQVRAFSRARIIVGTHGAGLTNVIWAPPGALLLELLPEQLDDAGYRFLSTLAGHRHYYLTCRQFDHPRGAAFADIEVDVARLRSELATLLSWSSG